MSTRQHRRNDSCSPSSRLLCTISICRHIEPQLPSRSPTPQALPPLPFHFPNPGLSSFSSSCRYSVHESDCASRAARGRRPRTSSRTSTDQHRRNDSCSPSSRLPCTISICQKIEPQPPSRSPTPQALPRHLPLHVRSPDLSYFSSSCSY